MEHVKILKEKILEKRELNSLNSEFLDKILEEVIRRNMKTYKILEEKNFNEKSKEFDEIKKKVRKKLREVYGVFQKDKLSENKKEDVLEKLNQAIIKKNKVEEQNIIKEILKTHISTKERTKNYVEFWNKINELKPRTILDLGCGLNPISYTFLKYKPKYIASDVSEQDMNFIKKYFEIKKINGEVIKADLTNEKDFLKIIEKSKEANCTLLLKLVDTLESLKRDCAKQLIRQLNTKIIVISVPNITISGKIMKKNSRNWLQKEIKQKIEMGWNIATTKLENEDIYFLENTKIF